MRFFSSTGGIIRKHVVQIKIKKERNKKMVNCMVCSRYAVKEGRKLYSFLFLVFVSSSNFVFVVAKSIFVRRSIFNINILKLCCRNEKNTGGNSKQWCRNQSGPCHELVFKLSQRSFRWWKLNRRERRIKMRRYPFCVRVWIKLKLGKRQRF